LASSLANDYLSVESLGPSEQHVLRDAVIQWLTRVVAALALMMLAPLLLLVAALVWFVDGGPVLFGHYRVGRNGKLFRCWKFRTMARDADERLEQLLASDPSARMQWEQQRKLAADPRVTPLGNFLRRSSIDELPQLLNVMRGEMVFVGPRPITYEELHRYGRERWYYLAVVPGITGLWQVSGRNELTYEERIALDRRYVESRTLMWDLRILLRTIVVVLGHKGAQ
jgi:exopolysaccharide production protein ExoY